MPIANDPLDPGCVLNALGKLKALLETTSAGELAAEEERTATVIAARRAARELAENTQIPAEAKRLELVEVHRLEQESAEHRHLQRQAWIEAKYHAARGSLTERIAQERDGKVGKVQSEVLKTQDERAREYAATKEELGTLRNKVAEDARRIGELEKEALKSLRSFKPLIAGKLAGKGVKVAMDDGKNLFARAEESLGHVRSSPLAKLFRFVPLSLCLKQEGGKWMLEGEGEVVLERAPDDVLETEIVHRLGKASVDSNRVEVPFSSITPEGDLWTEETGGELRVPIGRTGAKKLQYLSIGKGTKQHALIAGKTGSGKSTLFHVMVTNLALYCSPGEVEFYLVDFKKGVEFKCYGTKRLPHARVVAIESDREFGLSVLHRVDEELRKRGELFRECGSQDVAGYRKATGKSLPRTMLMIDEFQEFFTEDDGTGQEASLLLDRIVRQGRAFGIHVILGSQTLGGAYTLARATLGQMVIRIALQCNEADAYLIMDDDNPAPRLLTRPGEGIYNDNAGAVASNSPFQAVWLDEDERNARLDDVFVLVRDLQRFKSLKPEEEFSFAMDDNGGGGKSPSKVFQDLVTEGPAVGIHVLASVDTWSNVGRWIPRKTMSDFQMRVLFQMSGNDSAALIDTPAAGNLGLHRGLLYNEAMGSLETFRPYARVDAGVVGKSFEK